MDKKQAQERGSPVADDVKRRERRVLFRRIIIRLVLLYLLPLVLLAVFFNAQYVSLARVSTRTHLTALAERQAARLDHVIGEVWNQLLWISQEQESGQQIGNEELQRQLQALREDNPAVTAFGVIDHQGRSLGVVGGASPAVLLTSADDSGWGELFGGEGRRVFYEETAEECPRLVVAIRTRESLSRIYWVGLSIAPIRDDLATRLDEQGLRCAIVTGEGVYHIVDEDVAPLGGASSFRPPREPESGSATRRTSRGGIYGYAWLRTAELAAVVHGVSEGTTGWLAPELNRNVLIFTALFLILVMGTITLHARTQVTRSIEVKQKEEALSGQLVHAARLASVGELAAGIAHEINNPLAIVAEEVGLLMDLKNPELGGDLSDEELLEHLETMNEAVFRGRDITRKLLGFVRQTEVQIREIDIHELLDEVSTGYLGREFELSGVKIVREYKASPSSILTDRQQLSQVLLNLMKNAVDAMGGTGTLSLRTEIENQLLKISITDTGCGMSREQMERIFTPFYTTKDPGKGTGLGLSVSQGIVESLGGEMYVDSTLCEGSTFVLELPVDIDGEVID